MEKDQMDGEPHGRETKEKRDVQEIARISEEERRRGGQIWESEGAPQKTHTRGELHIFAYKSKASDRPD